MKHILLIKGRILTGMNIYHLDYMFDYNMGINFLYVNFIQFFFFFLYFNLLVVMVPNVNNGYEPL